MGERMSIKLGTVLKNVMEEKRYSVKEIAKATGVPATTIYEWLGNRVPKNPLQAREVAKFLGVTFHYLLFGEEDPKEPLQMIIKDDFFSGTFEINIKRVRGKL